MVPDTAHLAARPMQGCATEWILWRDAGVIARWEFHDYRCNRFAAMLLANEVSK